MLCPTALYHCVLHGVSFQELLCVGATLLSLSVARSGQTILVDPMTLDVAFLIHALDKELIGLAHILTATSHHALEACHVFNDVSEIEHFLCPLVSMFTRASNSGSVASPSSACYNIERLQRVGFFAELPSDGPGCRLTRPPGGCSREGVRSQLGSSSMSRHKKSPTPCGIRAEM